MKETIKNIIYDIRKAIFMFFERVRIVANKTKKKAIKKAKTILSLLMIPFAFSFAVGRAYERVHLMNNEGWRKYK